MKPIDTGFRMKAPMPVMIPSVVVHLEHYTVPKPAGRGRTKRAADQTPAGVWSAALNGLSCLSCDGDVVSTPGWEMTPEAWLQRLPNTCSRSITQPDRTDTGTLSFSRYTRMTVKPFSSRTQTWTRFGAGYTIQYSRTPAFS